MAECLTKWRVQATFLSRKKVWGIVEVKTLSLIDTQKRKKRNAWQGMSHNMLWLQEKRYNVVVKVVSCNDRLTFDMVTL